MKTVYLTLPYSPERYQVARRITKLLILQGYVVICPILQEHALDLPDDWSFWEKPSLALLELCDEVWVITLPGWGYSDRVQDEIFIAEYLNLKVVYIEPDHE